MISQEDRRAPPQQHPREARDARPRRAHALRDPARTGRALNNGGVSTIYVTGHRNPDTDSIASAIGYAELKRRLDPRNEYVPVRLGDVNAQTALGARARRRPGARVPAPRHAARARRHARELPVGQPARADPRASGWRWRARTSTSMPIVDDDGALAGVMTERTLARRYIRESREPSSLPTPPPPCEAIVEVIEGRLVAGEEREITGRVWVLAMDVGVAAGRDRRGRRRRRRRPRPTRSAARSSSASRLLVTSNGTVPSDEVARARPRARHHRRHLAAGQLRHQPHGHALGAVPGADERGAADRAPRRPAGRRRRGDQGRSTTARRSPSTAAGEPIGLVTHADLADPEPRRVLLVDHAEQAQSVPGVEQAEIVEILDHHHIGSIETKVPVTRDLRPGRLDRHAGRSSASARTAWSPARRRRRCCSGAVLSDTVILNSPTTTERDHAVVEYLERVLALDATDFGREMFEATSDVVERRRRRDRRAATPRSTRSARAGRSASPRSRRSGCRSSSAATSCRRRCERLREAQGLPSVRADGHRHPRQGHQAARRGRSRARSSAPSGTTLDDGAIDLPGVMSRKKQVAPKVLGAL